MVPVPEDLEKVIVEGIGEPGIDVDIDGLPRRSGLRVKPDISVAVRLQAIAIAPALDGLVSADRTALPDDGDCARAEKDE
jgi:hypothetical protein